MHFPIKVTAPLTHGLDVVALQKRLRSNKYGNFYPFEIDGVYGPITAGRVSAARWWLGYTTYAPVVDAPLWAYLLGTKPLTESMSRIRAARLKPAPPKPVPQPPTLRQEALAIALSRLSWAESPPGSNHCEATVRWGHGNMPWCAVFASLAYIDAAAKLGLTQSVFSAPAQRWQWVPGLLEAAHAGRGLKVVSHASAIPGDLVVHGPGAYHVSMFDHWASGKTSYWDVGGNEGSSGRVLHQINVLAAADTIVRVV